MFGFRGDGRDPQNTGAVESAGGSSHFRVEWALAATGELNDKQGMLPKPAAIRAYSGSKTAGEWHDMTFSATKR